MKTSKSFSTISYNTDDFLTIKLNDFIRKGYLEFWAFMNHKPEEDEKKAHKHVFLIPAKQVNTQSLGAELKEVDMNNPLNLPLGCIKFESSKFDHWYMYVLHDENYLATKGQKRKYHYTKEDIVCSDIDYLNELIATIDWAKLGNKVAQTIEAAKSGVPFLDYIQESGLGLYQVANAKRIYDLVARPGQTYRADRIGHEEPQFDSDGVLIEE